MRMIRRDFYAFVSNNMNVKHFSKKLVMIVNVGNGDVSLLLFYASCLPHKNTFSKYTHRDMC